MKALIKFVQFELKKMLKGHFFYIILALLLLGTVIYYGSVYLNANALYDKQITTNENITNDFKQFMDENQEAIDSGNLDENAVSELEGHNEFLKSQIKTSEMKVEGYKEKDWNALLNLQMELDQQLKQQATGLPPYDVLVGGRSLYAYRIALERNEILLEKDIQPVLPVDFNATIKDHYQDSAESMEELAIKHDSSGLYFTYELTGILFGVIGVIVFLFLFGDILTKESFGKDGSAQLLYTQPIKRQKIFIGKWLALMMVSLLILIGNYVVSILLGTLFNRFGDGNYPIVIYGEGTDFTFMNLNIFLLKALVLFYMVLLFAYALLYFFSVLTKSTLAAVGCTVVVILAGAGLVTQSFLSSITPYLPFSYFQVQSVLTHETAYNLENFEITFGMGMLILALYTGFILLMTSLTARMTVMKNN